MKENNELAKLYIADYTRELNKELFVTYRVDPASLRNAIDDIKEQVPPSLASQAARVDKASIVQDHESSFSDLTLGVLGGQHCE